MAQSEWQERLNALVAGPGASSSGNNQDLLERLLKTTTNAAGEGTGSGSDTGSGTVEGSLASVAAVFRDEATSLGERLSELARVSQAQTASVEDNTEAVDKSTASKVTDAVKSAVTSVSGLGSLSAGTAFLPLISGIAKLFGGGKTETETVTATYIRPAVVSVEAGIGYRNAQGEVRYDAEGVPRMVAVSGANSSPQISINVQAMDSRSFLDHREEIARAVREAMLESNALSDVVNDL